MSTHASNKQVKLGCVAKGILEGLFKMEGGYINVTAHYSFCSSFMHSGSSIHIKIPFSHILLCEDVGASRQHYYSSVSIHFTSGGA